MTELMELSVKMIYKKNIENLMKKIFWSDDQPCKSFDTYSTLMFSIKFKCGSPQNGSF